MYLFKIGIGRLTMNKSWAWEQRKIRILLKLSKKTLKTWLSLLNPYKVICIWKSYIYIVVTNQSYLFFYSIAYSDKTQLTMQEIKISGKVFFHFSEFSSSYRSRLGRIKAAQCGIFGFCFFIFCFVNLVQFL